jgi:hypothetical protein
MRKCADTVRHTMTELLGHMHILCARRAKDSNFAAPVQRLSALRAHARAHTHTPRMHTSAGVRVSPVLALRRASSPRPSCCRCRKTAKARPPDTSHLLFHKVYVVFKTQARLFALHKPQALCVKRKTSKAETQYCEGAVRQGPSLLACRISTCRRLCQCLGRPWTSRRSWTRCRACVRRCVAAVAYLRLKGLAPCRPASFCAAYHATWQHRCQ